LQDKGYQHDREGRGERNHEGAEPYGSDSRPENKSL
jgi:hypothetical protein